jgi:hypothetical protein
VPIGFSRLGAALTGVLSVAVGGVLVSIVSFAQNASIEIDTSAIQPGADPHNRHPAAGMKTRKTA